jgi:hypothetical protein
VASHDPAPQPQAERAPDFRRVIPRPQWLANRARNALRRPVFIGAVSVAAFLTAIVSMVVAPRSNDRRIVAPPPKARPDTMSVLTSAAVARMRITSIDSTIALERLASGKQLVADSTALISQPARNAILARVAQIDSANARAEQAPLANSYRALGTVGPLRDDPRVKALMDSLVEVDRERDALGSLGGVDPAFVALTARVNEIGHALEAIALEKRKELLAGTVDTLVRTDTLAAARVDTSALVAQRDSNRAAFIAAQSDLDRMRETSRAIDLEEDRERERANAVAPPLALLASAFVLSAIVGFAFAFFGELRRPRLSSATETEKVLGVRVLSTIEPSAPSAERTRRQSDREAPPYVDPNAEGYQLAYLGLATEHPTVLSAIVTGDDPRISAVVACNLAAIAADEARTTIIVELESSCSAASVLHARAIPGVSEVVTQGESWSNATVSAKIGRSRSVDLIPYGRVPAEPSAIAGAVGEAASRLADRYDGIIFLADPATVKAGLPAQAKAPAVVYCAQPGVSPISALSKELGEIREAGGIVRGVILWNSDRPMLATPRELAGGRSRKKEAPTLAMSH